MITKINGVYSLTDEKDIFKLPTKGVQLGSLAQLTKDNGDSTIYIFTKDMGTGNTSWVKGTGVDFGLTDEEKANIALIPGIKKDYEDAKVDYFGEEHINIIDRLNSDFDNVHQRINDSSYLEYSGSSITADNSYYGLTKDLSIKGMTLQNLLKDNTFKVTTSSAGGWKSSYLRLLYNLKANTKYLLIYNVTKNTNYYTVAIGGKDGNAFTGMDIASGVGTRKKIIQTYSDITNKEMDKLFIQFDNSDAGEIEINNMMILEYQEGLENIGISYFEGVKSVSEAENNLIGVKSCGKNLSDNKFMYNYAYDGATGNITRYNNRSTLIKKIPFKANQEMYFYIKQPKSDRSYVIRELYLFGINGNFMGKTGDFISDSVITMPYYDGVVGLTLMCRKNDTLEEVNFENEQIELLVCYSDTEIPYEPYQESAINYQLTEPLCSLPNGVCDEIMGDELIKRVGKVVLNGSEDWSATGYGGHPSRNTFEISIESSASGVSSRAISCLCDKFSSELTNVLPVNDDCCRISYSENVSGTAYYLLFTPSVNTIPYRDVSAWVQWLQQNPITVYYELVKPIVTKLGKKAELKSFDGTTHFISDNKLLPSLSVKVSSNVQAVIQDTRARNVELENELETTTLALKEADAKLNEMDTDLVKTTWEMDDRLYEVEWALEDAGLVEPSTSEDMGLVTTASTFNINNKMRGSIMALSKFQQAKIIIMSGDYNRVTLEGQLSKYLKRNIITQEEYDTLISMMNAEEIIVGE